MKSALALIPGLVLCACSAPAQSPYASDQAELPRDADAARALNEEAADLLESDPERAEELLRHALVADLFFGPAHNNLGILHLGRGELYEAAHEFEWARKLLPGHPDPRVNLAVTLDQAGLGQEARDALHSALDLRPGYVPALQGMARRAVLDGRGDVRLPSWLRRIAVEGETKAWRRWATRELSLLRD